MKRKGYTKAAEIKRQGIELIQFNLRTEPENLQIVDLRITQAIRRNPNLKELLEPALAEISEVLKMNKQSRNALSELQ